MHYVFGACNCPSHKDDLPKEICDSAMRGMWQPILDYIKNGGDTNASCGLDGWTLLGAACSMGQKSVVQQLLRKQEIHLNRRSMNDTPLAWALREEHFDCVELLLRSSTECSLDLQYSWSKILSYLEEKPDDWVYAFNIISSYHDFDSVNELLKLKNETWEVDPSFMKMSFEKSPEEMIGNLKNKNGTTKYLDGTLITLSCLNASEQVTRYMVFYPHEYSTACIELSLILSSYKSNLNVLSTLLSKFFPNVSYEALCKAHQISNTGNCHDANRLLTRALTVKCQILIPLPDARMRADGFDTKPNSVYSVVEEIPSILSISESTTLVNNPAESIELGTELGTPALESMNSKVNDISKNLSKVTLGTTPFSMEDLLKQAVEAQVKVAEALSLASNALAMVTKTISPGKQSHANELSPNKGSHVNLNGNGQYEDSL